MKQCNYSKLCHLLQGLYGIQSTGMQDKKEPFAISALDSSVKPRNDKVAIKKFLLITAAFLTTLLFLNQASAVCPLCTIVVGAGIGVSHWLGVDDTITGLWIGGFTVSLIIWTIDWLNKKNICFYGRKILIVLIYYACIVLPLYPMGYMGNPLDTLWGMNKLLLGIIIGSILFFVGNVSYIMMKKHNKGHAYFPFQKVVMPVLPLIILTIIFYFITS